MRWLDLFSGIGMYALGLEQAGHEVIGFCEKDVWARKVLKKHWPMKPISSSIKLLNKKLTGLSPDSPVKILPQRQVPAYPGIDRDSFGNLLEPFAWYDQNTSCWRTWQLYFGRTESETHTPYSEAWPSAGMILSGIAYRRLALAHHISAPEHTFLASPLASERNGAFRKRYRGSPNLPLSRTSETLRTCETDPKFLDGQFAEMLMGLPKDYTALETEIHHV